MAASQPLPQGDDERDDDRDEDDDDDEDETHQDEEDEEDDCTASGWTGATGGGGGRGGGWATFELLAALGGRPRRCGMGCDEMSNRSPFGEKYNAES